MARAPLARDAVELGQLVEVVDDDTADGVAAHRRLELLGALVVAVEVEPRGGETRRPRDRQLAPADHVHAQPLLLHDGGQGQAQVRLRRVEHRHLGPARLELAAELACGLAEVLLVEHVEGRAVRLGQIAQVTAADAQAPGGGEGGGVGEHVAVGQGVEGSGVRHGRDYARRRSYRPTTRDGGAVGRPILAESWRLKTTSSASPTSTTGAVRAWSTSPARR